MRTINYQKKQIICPPSLNLTIRHIIGEYPNNTNKNRYGKAKSTHCHICKANSNKIMGDNTHHNLWECDMVLMSSTCRKLKQLIFSFIGAKTTITNCDLIEETSIRDNAGFTLVILNLNARRPSASWAKNWTKTNRR